MGTKKFVSLKKKLFLSIGIPTFLFTIIVSSIIFFQTEKQFSKIREEEQMQMTINESKIMNDLFLIGRDTAQNISKTRSIVDMLEREETTSEEKDILRSLLQNFNLGNIFSSIYIMDISGNTIVSTDPSFEGKNYSFRKYFQKAKAGENSTDMAIGITSQKPGFYFSSPVRNNQGVIIGVAITKLDIDVIEKTLIDDKHVGYTNYMLVGTDGMILTSNIEDRIFKNLDADLLSANEKESIKTQYNLSSIQTLDYKDVFQNIRNNIPMKQMSIFDTLEQEEEIYSLMQIDSFPYYFVTEHYQKLITDLVIHISLFALSAQMIGGAIIILVAFFVISRFLQPLNNLQQMTEKIRKGEFEQTLSFDTNDEIHELGTSMIHMASELKNSYENMNNEVQGRE